MYSENDEDSKKQSEVLIPWQCHEHIKHREQLVVLVHMEIDNSSKSRTLTKRSIDANMNEEKCE